MPTASTLDVYRDWLGIEETSRPLNHYQLLRLRSFEDNASKFPQRYRRMTGHVRKHSPAEHAELAEKLIREVVGAVLCLSDAQRKREYDRKLGRPEEGRPEKRSMEQVLLERKSIGPEELAKAKNFALAVGFELRDALIQRKLATAEDVMTAYAESVGLPFLDKQDVHPDETLVGQISALLARKNSCVPLMIDDEQLLVVSPFPIGPQAARELSEKFGKTVRTVLCTPGVVNNLLDRHYSRARNPVNRIANLAKNRSVPTSISGQDAAVQDIPAPAKSPSSVPAKSPSSPGSRRTESVAAALAEMQAASRGDDEEQIAARAAAKHVAKAPDSPEDQQFRQMVAFAGFSLSATVFQTSYAIYAYVFFHPFYFSIFLLGWVLAAVVGGLTWFVTKMLSS